MRGVDEISALHDPLLIHILSYLPTKKAVGTTGLSKRWKNVGASVPVLDFNFADFWSEDIFLRTKYSTYVNELSECHENFVRVIDAVLASRQGQQIDRFTLVWKYQVKSYPYHGHPVTRWINLVLQQSPRVLSIYVKPSDTDVEVPGVAFTCSSLEEMKLQVDQEQWPEVLEPNLVNLPSLIRLNLGYFTIKADFMSNLLLGCPKLEELELYACGLNLSQISCSNLKSLVLDGCCNFAKIRVSIPSLQYLKVTIMSSQTAGFVFENMQLLVKASVCFLTDVEFERAFYNSEAKILNGLSRVTKLDVVLHGPEAANMLKHALENCPYFENLKAVHFEKFDGCLIYCMDVIDRLVWHSPILEKLTFYCCKDLCGETELLEMLREVVSGHENCQLVESKHQGHIYESLDELKELLLRYMLRFEKMMMEITEAEVDAEAEAEAEEEEENGGGGGGGVGGEAWWEEGEAGEDDEGLTEEEEGDVEQ